MPRYRPGGWSGFYDAIRRPNFLVLTKGNLVQYRLCKADSAQLFKQFGGCQIVSGGGIGVLEKDVATGIHDNHPSLLEWGTCRTSLPMATFCGSQCVRNQFK